MASGYDFLIRMDEGERDGLNRRARAAGMSTQQFVRERLGIEGEDHTEAFAAAARRAGERFDASFAELDQQLAGRGRAHAIGLAAGVDEDVTGPAGDLGRAAAA